MDTISIDEYQAYLYAQ